MLSRKHYRIIAEVIKNNKQVIQVGDKIDDMEEVIDVEGLICGLSNAFKRDNNLFNRDTFIKACND